MVDASTSTSTDDLELPTALNDQTEVSECSQVQSPQSSPNFSQVSIEPGAEAELEKEPPAIKVKSSVRSQVEAELEAQPSVTSEADIASLRELLLTLSSLIKDRRLSDHFRGRLLSKYVLTKLPPSMVEQYRRSSPRGESFGGQLQQNGGGHCSSRQPNKMAMLRLRHYLGDHLLDIFARSPPPAAQMLAITAAGEAEDEEEEKVEDKVKPEMELSPERRPSPEVVMSRFEELKQLETLMVAELAPLPPVSDEDDVAALEALLATVASVRQLLRLFSSQSLPGSPASFNTSPSAAPAAAAAAVTFISEEREGEGGASEEVLYEVLAGKLPQPVRRRAEHAERLRRRPANLALLCCPEKSLSALSRTLTRLISDHYRKKGIERQQQQQQSLSTSVGHQQLFCTYCKELGHLTTDCVLPKAMLCYRCFQVGHKARNCPVSAQHWRFSGNGRGLPSSPAAGAVSFDKLCLNLEEAYKGKGKMMPSVTEKEYDETEENGTVVRLENGQLFGPKEGIQGQQLCLECVTFGHRTADCRRVFCFRCKQPGHMRSGCPLPKSYYPAATYTSTSSHSSSSSSSSSSKGERQKMTSRY